MITSLLTALLLTQGVQAPRQFETWQGFNPFGGAATVVLSAPFAPPGCYASPTQQGTALVTVTRATQQTINSGGTTCAANELGVESTGASIWKASTNSVLNSGTHPKIGEATASLGTGAYVGWHAGTGTMTIAAGTATVTGLSCTAVSPGTLCPFTVTVAGTMVITTSAGTVTQAQIEPGTYDTPYIPTAAAAVTRNATNANAPISALGDRFCVSVTATPGGGRAWGSSSGDLLGAGTGGAANGSFYLIESFSGMLTFDMYDSVPAVHRVQVSHASLAWSAGSTHRITACNNSGVVSLCADGVLKASAGSAGTRTTERTPLYFGSRVGSSLFDGNISNVKVCRGATKCSDCR